MSNKNGFPAITTFPYVIQRLVRHFDGKSECPNEFLAGALLSVLATVCGPYYRINDQSLNLYVLLSGPTASKKSTAIKVALHILQTLVSRYSNKLCFPYTSNEQQQKLEALGIVTNFSIEGLQLHHLKSGTSTLATLQEFGALISVSKRQGQSNTIPELTSMYDGQYFSSANVSRGKCSSSDFSLSILGASTMSWLADFYGQTMIGAGFNNRFLTFIGAPQNPVPIPIALPEVELIWLADHLETLLPEFTFCENTSSLKHETKKVLLSPEAKELWDAYYCSRSLELRSLTSERTQELCGRELTHALKLAALKAISEKRLVVIPTDLIFGCELSLWCVRNAVLNAGSQTDLGLSGPYKRAGEKIVKLLTREIVLSKSEIARAIGGKQDTVNSALIFLNQNGTILEDHDGTYRLTEEFNSQHEEVSEFFCRSSICDTYENLRVGSLLEEPQENRPASASTEATTNDTSQQ